MSLLCHKTSKKNYKCNTLDYLHFYFILIFTEKNQPLFEAKVSYCTHQKQVKDKSEFSVHFNVHFSPSNK